MKKRKIGIFIQARSRSTRLPGKIFEGLPVPGEPSILEHIYKRLSMIPGNYEILNLIPDNDERLREFCIEKKLPMLAGPEDDVRARYRLAARLTDADIIVRATADNPCVDPGIALDTIRGLIETEADLFSFSNLPLGVAVEAFRREALFDETVKDAADYREHVSLHIKHNPSYFKVVHQDHPVMNSYCNGKGRCSTSDLPRLTVDTPEDLIVARNVFMRLGSKFSVARIMDLFTEEPELFAENAMVRQITFAAPVR
jgi:spore coat polysaccharide biosynthesis protein SpsF